MLYTRNHSFDYSSIYKSFIVSFIGIVSALTLLVVLQTPQTAKALDDYELSGYAWSSNVGWISFNCENTSTCGTSEYSVRYNPADGSLSGYAWSSNVGWLQFGGLSGFPSGNGTYSGNAKIESGTLKGWARFVAGSGRTDGWDGWVSLGGTNHTISLNSTTGAISGYAWGSDVVGWISMNGIANDNSPYGVTIKIPAVSALDFGLNGSNSLSINKGQTSSLTGINLSRVGTSGSGTVALSVTHNGSTNLSSVSVSPSSCALSNSSTSCALTLGVISASTAIAGTYQVTITASAGGIIRTHVVNVTINAVAGPTLTCSANPTSANVGQTVTWSVTATGGAGTGAYTYSWTGTDSLSGNTASVNKTYTTTGTKSAIVTVSRGGASATCSGSVSINTSSFTYNVSGGSNISMLQNGQYIASASVNPSNRITINRTSGVGTSGAVTLTATVTKGGVTSSDISVSNIAPTPCSIDDVNIICHTSYTLNASAGANGTYRVTFSAGAHSTGFDVTVGTLATPTVSCSANPSSANVGQTVTWSVAATGGAGTGAYTYSWTGTDGLSGTAMAIAKAYSTTGTKSATVTATRAGVSNTATCTVSIITITSTFSLNLGSEITVTRGQTVVIPANDSKAMSLRWVSGDGAQVTSGLGYYKNMAYVKITDFSNWGILSVILSVYNQEYRSGYSVYIAPNAPFDSYPIEITSTNGFMTVRKIINVNVVEQIPNPLTYTSTITPNPINLTSGGLGASFTHTVTRTGGTGTVIMSIPTLSGANGINISAEPQYTCNLTGASNTCTVTRTITALAEAPTQTRTLSAQSYNQATPSVIQTAESTVVVTSPPIGVSCSASPTDVPIGSTIKWTATPNPVTLPTGMSYSYSWTGFATGGDQTESTTINMPGIYTSTVTLTRSDGQTASASCSVKINSGGGGGEF